MQLDSYQFMCVKQSMEIDWNLAPKNLLNPQNGRQKCRK